MTHKLQFIFIWNSYIKSVNVYIKFIFNYFPVKYIYYINIAKSKKQNSFIAQTKFSFQLRLHKFTLYSDYYISFILLIEEIVFKTNCVSKEIIIFTAK